MHYSTTKYLGGHSDVVGGALVTSNDALHERLQFLQNAVGGVPGPFDSWLVLRGSEDAGAAHAPAHEQCPAGGVLSRAAPEGQGRSLPRAWRATPSTTWPRGRWSAASAGCCRSKSRAGSSRRARWRASTRLFTLAESLGGVESLIELPALMTHASLPPERRAEIGIDDGLIRLSVGIEEPEDLIADLEQALG